MVSSPGIMSKSVHPEMAISYVCSIFRCVSMASIDVLGVSAPGWLRLLYLLVGSPKTPTELAALEKKHLSEVSRTLRTMRDSGLVEFVNTGSRERYYHATEQGYFLVRSSLR